MKKLFISFALLLLSYLAQAQSSYEKIMISKISKIENSKNADEFTALSNDFIRIGDKEKTDWLPYYYAALTQIQKGRLLMQNNTLDALDPVAEEAQKYLDKAIALSPENAENYILQKMIHSLKMMVNPMERFRTEGKAASNALAKAEKIDPENPRISLLKAEDTYFTPAQFGGSKEKGLVLFQKALDQYASYKTEKPILPNWGKAEAEYFLTSKP